MGRPLEALTAVVVDLSEQHVYMYNQAWLVAILPVSSGASGTPTGSFRVQGHTRVGTSGSDARVHMDFFTTFNGNIGFHGIPWVSTRARRLPTPLGIRPVSHGCVRLYEENVQELFELVQLGTPVTVLP